VPDHPLDPRILQPGCGLLRGSQHGVDLTGADECRAVLDEQRRDRRLVACRDEVPQCRGVVPASGGFSRCSTVQQGTVCRGENRVVLEVVA
jgi:hypothetical protein